MIGMASVDLDEASQIRKSLDYGEKKLQEIAEKAEELRLLTDDLRSLKARLLERLAALENRGDRPPSNPGGQEDFNGL